MTLPILPLDTAIPACPHFGTCGGCQLQNIPYPSQLHGKQTRLTEILTSAGITSLPAITVHPSEPYAYRNRIRLRVLHTPTGTLRLGYNTPAGDPIPITTCPIAALGLWDTGESLLVAARRDRDAAFWLDAASEVELFANHDPTRVAPIKIQITLLCAPRTKSLPGSFDRAFAAFQSHSPITIAGLGAIASDPRTGPTGRSLASAGSSGLAYQVADETYWITRGGFFQINRFLLTIMLRLVTQKEDGQPRSGTLAWDLYAGVGLFSRILARSFAQIVAVEANPTAASDNRSALAKLSPAHQAIESTTLDFLRSAILQRDRPSLIVLDPPRAGVGLEACDLLHRNAAPTLVYVSCDPTTLARDLAVLQPHYTLTALHILDLFPQTSHLETIAILTHRSSQPQSSNNS